MMTAAAAHHLDPTKTLKVSKRLKKSRTQKIRLPP